MFPTILEANEADLNTPLTRFWDLETIGITAETSENGVVTSDEKLAWKKVDQFLTYNGERYVVAVPWKNKRPSLENNRPIAERRLQLQSRSRKKHEDS